MTKKSEVTARERARQISPASARRTSGFAKGVVVAATAFVIALVTVIILSVNQGKQQVADLGPMPAGGTSSGGIMLISSERLAEQDSDTVDLGSVPSPPAEIPAGGLPATPGGIKKPAMGDPVQLIIYQDPNCSHCASFEAEYSNEIQEMLSQGLITLEHRNLGMLDAGSPTNYSSRASNALACVADNSPASYLPFSRELFESQSAGELKNAELSSLAQKHGAQVDKCIADGEFRPFVKYATEVAAAEGVTATPSVVLGGEMWDPTADPDFLAWTMSALK